MNKLINDANNFLYGDAINESGYVELISNDPNWDVKGLEVAWSRWKKGPLTKSSDIAKAKKEVLDFISRTVLK